MTKWRNPTKHCTWPKPPSATHTESHRVDVVCVEPAAQRGFEVSSVLFPHCPATVSSALSPWKIYCHLAAAAAGLLLRRCWRATAVIPITRRQWRSGRCSRQKKKPGPCEVWSCCLCCCCCSAEPLLCVYPTLQVPPGEAAGEVWQREAVWLPVPQVGAPGGAAEGLLLCQLQHQRGAHAALHCTDWHAAAPCRMCGVMPVVISL